MDKNAIKKYAVWARRELIERVSQRAMIFGITAKDTGDPNADSVNGHLLTQTEKRQRQALIRNIKDKGYEQVMEEVAYTWFNRFAALRFMEVNGYLPSHVRIFTNDAGEFKPQILSEAIHLEMDGLDMNKVYELANANKNEELYKYLLIVQCNALNSILPGMFQKIEDYTELLLPDYLLREGSVIEQIVTTIPEEDWTDQVQIIGWLYQFYNTEPKEKVFADLQKNIKITKENIPAATQLFTPDWIVHYMVENSLGRLWLEGHPNDALKSEWRYYLDEADQEPEVEAQLAEIRKECAALKPEEIKAIDPCMGSGHILCVLFDVLVRIYEDYGYTARDAAASIVENNLWGLDIDERAAQLSYFAVMMKARQYDRRFFARKVQPHVYAIEESNGITSTQIQDMGQNLSHEEYAIAVNQTMRLVEEMHDAKEYGSLIYVTPCDWDLLQRFVASKEEEGQMCLDFHAEIETSKKLKTLINNAKALAQKYDIVVTNPPYMGGSGMTSKLADFVRHYYPDSKSDLFAVFIERVHRMLQRNGYQSMITQHSWMFLASFEKLRIKVQAMDIINMIHLGLGAFEEISGGVVQTTSFVIKNTHLFAYRGMYIRLIEPTTQQGKEDLFLSGLNRFVAQQKNFAKIPGSPMAYWASKRFLDAFSHYSLGDLCDLSEGIHSRNNDAFMRLWYEVGFEKSALSMYSKDKKWYPCNKGGSFRKWYGNNDFVIDWQDNGKKLKAFPKASAGSDSHRFEEGITFTTITSTERTFRLSPKGFLYDMAGPTFFMRDNSWEYYVLAVFSSKLGYHFLSAINPGMSLKLGEVKNFPIILDEQNKEDITRLAKENVWICKEDWDSFETSWDFIEHPFIRSARWIAKDGEAVTLDRVFKNWNDCTEKRFTKVKNNEETLNNLFIDIYGLNAELNPEVEEKAITIRRADQQREVRSFISYAVGCMFGRYTLDKRGLIYAGGEWDPSQYLQFQPDNDAIIPISSDEYFEDDIVGHFISFVAAAFGRETLEENLHFIAQTLGGKGTPREVIRNYFIKDFYADHLKTYQRCPIYWLFDSGKKNGFKCLIYMHRYQPDTIARIRTDYVHEQQSRYRTAIADLEQRINGASTSERVKLSKQLTKLQEQAEELRVYEEKIHHLADQMIKIDLDDGVKHNYELFKDVLAKIK